MNSKRKILLRADGDSKIGLGHMYRMYALVEMLNDTFETSFLSRNIDFIARNLVKVTSSFQVPEKLLFEEEPKWIYNNFDPTDNVLILDGYQFDTQYQSLLKENGFTLICIDDLANSHMFADLVINHSLGFKESDYKSEGYTEFALGAKYALLRKAFLEVSSTQRRRNNLDKGFVCFGGSDPYDFTLKAVKALLKMERITEVYAVLGSSYGHQDIYQIKDSRLKISKSLGEQSLIEVMKMCTLAIAPASTISYELCSVGILLYSGYYIENQKKLYNGLLEQKLIHGCGDFNEFDFEGMTFEESGETIEMMLTRQRQCFDGKSNDRLKSKIIEYI